MKKSNRNVSLYRIEVLNHEGKFDLVGLGVGLKDAFEIQDRYDDYYTRIVKCGRPRGEPICNFDTIQTE